MAKILLGCLIGSIPNQGVRAITALLDFIYLAQYTTHDSYTLGYLKDALKHFHENRQYFVAVGTRKDFNIPKFHSLMHYVEAIENFGTTDNYNTELFERLHIDFAKQGWRATNQRDEFPQMMRWLSRREKLMELEAFQQHHPENIIPPCNPSSTTPPISIAKHANYINRSISVIEDKHCAPDFSYYLKVYLNDLAPVPTAKNHLRNLPLPFQKLNTYNMFRFHPQSLDEEDNPEEQDIVKAIPKSTDLPNGQFDTVVVMVKDTAESTSIIG